jgi:hypothetical protein
MTVAVWLQKGRELFGDDWSKWRFECPCCGNVQTPADFAAIGAEPQGAYQECIGRHTVNRAKNLGSVAAADGAKSPCDYAAYGLFNALRGHKVLSDSGKTVSTLPFAVTGSAVHP